MTKDSLIISGSEDGKSGEMQNRHLVKKQFTHKLIQQALFGDNIFAQISALVLLSKNNDPETGWLLKTLIEKELILKSSRR